MSSTIRLAPVFVAMILALATSCTTADQPQAVGLPPLGVPFDCRNPIDALNDLPDDYRSAADVVAFPTTGLIQRGRTGPDNDPDSIRSFSKFGLLIRADTTFQIHVAAGSQANALIGWGATGANGPVSSISVAGCNGRCDVSTQPGCPEGDDWDWVVYPGGIWTIDPDCVRLTVLTTDEAVTVELPVGAPCA